MFALLVVFGTAKLLAELFERLHQPALAGELLAGILIGPAALGWVRPNPMLNALAELGVMFLLFRVGLEVSPRKLMSVGRRALLVASLGVLVPFALGWGVMSLWHEGSAESIFVAAALVATSVGITAQILAARGVLSHRASEVILAAAVIDDVLGFLVLAVVSSVARGMVMIPELVLSGAIAAGFTLAVVRWGARAMNRILPRLQGSLRAGEVQFNLAMVTLFGLALIATYAGVAALIGAFLAGVTLSESLPERVHTLTLGVSELLTPFFLTGIGLYLNLGALLNRRTMLLALIIAVIAVISKLLGCGLGALGMGRADAIRIGVGMVPRGEVGMVVAQIGLSMKVISPAIYGIVVVVSVFTTLIAPFLLHAAFREVSGKGSETSEEVPIA